MGMSRAKARAYGDSGLATKRRVGAEREDSRMILRQTKLALRAEHPFRLHAANDGGFQRRLFAELRADQGKWSNHAGLHVGLGFHGMLLSLAL